MEPKIRLKGCCGELKTSSLSQVATMHARIGWQNLRKDEFLPKGDYYLITGTNFVDGVIDYHSCYYVSEERYNQDKNIQLKEGSILITKDGTLGKVAYVDNLEKPATLNAGVFNVVCKMDIIDSRFLYQYLKSPRLMNYVNSTATGGTIKHLNQNILVSFPVRFPENEEQKFIGTYFQQLDSLIQSTAKKIESLKQVKAASLQSMFPQEGETVPRVRFKGFEGEWKQIVMSDVGYMTAGGTPSTFEDSYWNGDINWLQSGAVQNNIILPSAVERKITKEGLSNSAAHLVQKDSVLIAITGATCANIGYLTFNSTANQSVVSVEPYRGFDSKFVYQSLMINRNQILSFKGGSAQSGVTLSNLKKMSILCPDYQEQQKIGCFFFNIEEMIMQCMTRLEKLKQIKTACLDNMFV